MSKRNEKGTSSIGGALMIIVAVVGMLLALKLFLK